MNRAGDAGVPTAPSTAPGSRAARRSSRRVRAHDDAPLAPFVALLAIVAAMPWALGGNRDWIWPWFALATFALTAVHATMVLAGAWSLGRALRSSRATQAFLIALVAWVGSGAAYLVLAPAGALADPDAAWRDVLQQAGYGALAWLALATIDSRRRLTMLLAVLFVVGVAQAVFGAVMSLSGLEWGAFGTKLVNRGVATGSFVNRNHLAGYLALTGALGVGLLAARFDDETAQGWRERLRGWLRWLMGPGAWTRVALALLVVGLILTRSRMGNLAFAAALTLAGAIAVWLVRPRPRKLVVLLVSILAIDALLLGSWFGIERVAQRVAATTVQRDAAGVADSDAERVDVTASTLRLWRAHPHLGVGPGGFRAAFPSVKPPTVQLFYDHAHDDWAQRLAERGWLGVLPWVSLWIVAFAAAVRALRRAPDARTRGIALGCLAALIAAALHGLVDFNGQVPAYAGSLSLVMAAAVLARALRPANPRG